MAQVLQPKKGQSVLPPPAYIPLSGEDKHIAIVGGPGEKTKRNGSLDRDVALAEVWKGKRTSYIKAWEENEKTKADNKADKRISLVGSWENKKKADLEASLRKTEQKLERKKAGYGETVKNKVASVHKQAEEKRATIQGRRGEDLLKVEETSAKYRATDQVPKKTCGCF